MMPVASYQIPGAARVLIFTCEGCGDPAMFGEGCNIMAALRSGDPAKAGRWWCARRPDGSGYCRREAAE